MIISSRTYSKCLIYAILLTGMALPIMDIAALDIDNLTSTKKLVEKSPDISIPYNISHYIYHDLNSNGVYDSNDRVLSGIGVTMMTPDGISVTQRSNIHGFANYTTMLDSSVADIGSPGEYIFTVSIPPGWKISSNNSVQAITFNANKSSRPGITAEHTPEPTGLSQELTISGTPRLVKELLDTRESMKKTVIRITDPDNQVTTIDTEFGKQFILPASAGKWQLDFTHAGQLNYLTRNIMINSTPVHLGNLVIDSVNRYDTETDLHTHTEDFENITEAAISKIPMQDNEMQWINMIAVENAIYRGDGYINNTVSGNYIGYNTSGYPVTIQRSKPFDFVGGYFGVAWPEGEGESLVAKAWRDDQLVSTDSFSLSAYGPVWFQADYISITRLELSTDHYWQFVADDFKFRL